MPGMATDSEIAKLQGLTGTESDIYFLQLMIRHHQGGVPMMQYAAEHATNPVVRNFASKMAQSQEPRDLRDDPDAGRAGRAAAARAGRLRLTVPIDRSRHTGLITGSGRSRLVR